MDKLPPIIRTKIILPSRRAELLTRHRLLNALTDLMDRRLIIIAAPAGYGKTSLLIDFSHQVEWPVCWYALDPLDQDLFRFAAYLISALQVRFPDFGSSALQTLENLSQEQPNLDLLVAAIVNDAYEHINEHFILVLDDFHLVDSSKPVNQFINRFLQDMDENCHIITASRTLLTLPDLPLMVARSQVGGLSFEELAFLPAEIQGFFLQNQHVAIPDNQAEDLARLIRQLFDQGKSIIVIEHNMTFAMQLCQRVVVLAQGQIIASGPPAQIRADERVINAYLGQE